MGKLKSLNTISKVAKQEQTLATHFAQESKDIKDSLSPISKIFNKTKKTFRRVRPLDDYQAEILWAPKEYELIRKCQTDIKKIAKNTGWPEFRIKRIKKHIFYDSHILDTSIDKFHTDPEIAAAWNRLRLGDFIRNDIKLLEHEYFESKFERLYKTNYRIAHSKAYTRRDWDPPK